MNEKKKKKERTNLFLNFDPPIPIWYNDDLNSVLIRLSLSLSGSLERERQGKETKSFKMRTLSHSSELKLESIKRIE